MKLTPAQIEEGRKLLAAATPGPWQQSYYVDHPRYATMGEPWKERMRSNEANVIRGSGVVGDPSCNVVARFDGSDADRALVIWLRNHAMQLLQEGSGT